MVTREGIIVSQEIVSVYSLLQQSVTCRDQTSLIRPFTDTPLCLFWHSRTSSLILTADYIKLIIPTTFIFSSKHSLSFSLSLSRCLWPLLSSYRAVWCAWNDLLRQQPFSFCTGVNNSSFFFWIGRLVLRGKR